jgi:hypothetical protein
MQARAIQGSAVPRRDSPELDIVEAPPPLMRAAGALTASDMRLSNDARAALAAVVRPLTASGFQRQHNRARALFSLRSAELVQRLLMQEANLSQVSLRFRNVVPYRTQLVADCDLARMIQRGFKALDAKRSTRGKGISLLDIVAGYHGSILTFAGT